MNRQQRRTAERAERAERAARRRFLDDRFPVSGPERDDVRARQLALLDQINWTVTDTVAGRVAVLVEGCAPLLVPMSELPVELHPDTRAMLTQCADEGRLPCLTLVAGWANVSGLDVYPLSPGGQA